MLAGGTGQVGTILARHYHAAGDDVVVLSRTPRPAPWRTVAWDAKTLGPWTSHLENADAVIGLAGRSVNCRYTAGKPRSDHVVPASTPPAQIGAAIARASRPPSTWLQMSTATIYAHRYDAPNDEATGIIGGAEPNSAVRLAVQHRRRARLGRAQSTKPSRRRRAR